MSATFASVRDMGVAELGRGLAAGTFSSECIRVTAFSTSANVSPGSAS